MRALFTGRIVAIRDTMAKSVVTLGLDNLLPPSSLVRTVLSFVRAITTCRRSIYF